MCFAVNQGDKAKIEKLLKSLAKKESLNIGWEPNQWIQAHSRPLMPVLSETRSVELLQWGLIPSYTASETQAKEISLMTLNARSETMFTLPSFRESAPRQRCLIPINSFYEYQQVVGQKKKIPYEISMKDHSVYFLAGLWSLWQGKKTFTLCTMEANSLMAEIHNTKNRMPVIVTKDNIDLWLSPGTFEQILPVLMPSDELPLVATPIQKPVENPKTSQMDLFDY